MFDVLLLPILIKTAELEEATHARSAEAYVEVEGQLYGVAKRGGRPAVATLIAVLRYCFAIGLTPVDRNYYVYYRRSEGWPCPPWWVSLHASNALAWLLEVVNGETVNDYRAQLAGPVSDWLAVVAPGGYRLEVVNAERIHCLLVHLQTGRISGYSLCPWIARGEEFCSVCGAGTLPSGSPAVPPAR